MSAPPPILAAPAFTCPTCRAFAQQMWWQGVAKVNAEGWHPELYGGVPRLKAQAAKQGKLLDVPGLSLSQCGACAEIGIWLNDRIVYPSDATQVEAAAEDMPEDVRREYDEAGAVLKASPRAAAALLRLAVERLANIAVNEDMRLNDAIGDLVRRGLDVRVQQALDIVRVVGNYAVHPGQIDLRDDQETATRLFQLVNLIVDFTIAQPKRIAAMYGSLPPAQLAQIERRDS